MSEQKTELTMYQIADQFIALANQLSQQENDIGKVGTAMRFAAARYNAFEAAIKSTDLAAEKDKLTRLSLCKNQQMKPSKSLNQNNDMPYR
jgi:hypothetical protein